MCPSTAQIALVIGNNDYLNTDLLHQPVADARVFAEELRRVGFDVRVGENLTKEQTQRALDSFYAAIQRNSVALLFFSGHGIQGDNRQSYIVPVDAQISEEADIGREGFSVEQILSRMQDRGAAVKLVIVDASRPNSFENFRKAPLGLAPSYRSAGHTSHVLGCAEGRRPKVSDANSLFVTELIKQLQDPNQSAEEAFNRTRMTVSRASHGEQTPWLSSSLTKDFAFHSTGDRKPGGHLTSILREDPQPTEVQPSPPPLIQPQLDPEITELNARILNNPEDASALYKRGIYHAQHSNPSLALKDFIRLCDFGREMPRPSTTGVGYAR